MELIEADRIEVLVVVDNLTDFLSTTPPFVTGEVMRLLQRGATPTNGGVFCCAAHGLSLLITAYGPAGPRTLMFDGGPASYAMEMNGARLGIDFGKIEAIVLSHGHWDHAGGIPQALKMIRAANSGYQVPLTCH